MNFLLWHHSQFRDNMATEAMLTLATDAQGDLKKFQENLENWYNAAMDRASGCRIKEIYTDDIAGARAFDGDGIQRGFGACDEGAVVRSEMHGKGWWTRRISI